MIEINLHPSGERAAAKRRRGKIAFTLPSWPRAAERSPLAVAAVVVPALAIVALLSAWFLQRGQFRDLEARLQAATADSVRLSDLRQLSDSLLSQERLLRERVDLISQLDNDRFVWPHLLDEISRALPPYAWLTAIQLTSPAPMLRVQIQGLAATPLEITTFVRNLDDSPYIADVRILGSQQQSIGDLLAQAFTLVIAYSQPPPALIRTEPMRMEGL